MIQYYFSNILAKFRYAATLVEAGGGDDAAAADGAWVAADVHAADPLLRAPEGEAKLARLRTALSKVRS